MKTPNTGTFQAVIELSSYGHDSRYYILQYVDITHGVYTFLLKYKIFTIWLVESACEKVQIMKTPNTGTFHAVIKMSSYGHVSRHCILQSVDITHGV